jgi:hypothetical protein
MSNVNPKFFKIYVCVSLSLIVVLFVLLIGSVAFGVDKLKTETTVVTDKVNTFNQNVSAMNKNLQNIDSQLVTQNKETAALKVSGL